MSCYNPSTMNWGRTKEGTVLSQHSAESKVMLIRSCSSGRGSLKLTKLFMTQAGLTQTEMRRPIGPQEA